MITLIPRRPKSTIYAYLLGKLKAIRTVCLPRWERMAASTRLWQVWSLKNEESRNVDVVTSVDQSKIKIGFFIKKKQYEQEVIVL